MDLDAHPTVLKARSKGAARTAVVLDATWLKAVAKECGADDVGLVEIDRPALKAERGHIAKVFAGTRTLLSLVVRMNREPVRSPTRSVANQEFHAVHDAVNEVAREIVRRLEAEGIPACNAVGAFPMEVQLPGRGWMVAHKPIAVEAGLGMIGLHRNVIHPVFGSFVLLETVLIGRDASAYDRPIDYNPCFECKLCVAACPVGAIKSDGAFDFMSCYTHNYREFLGNFGDWVAALTDAKDHRDYRRRFDDGETTSMWQSLSFKPGYKAAYCIAVCPAGEEVINPFLEDRKGYLSGVVKPLTAKEETLYVLPGSDAEEHAVRRFPHKRIKHVKRQLRASSIPMFMAGLRLGFQRGKAKDLSARYHWTFTGKEEAQATIRIHDGRIAVEPGHVGEPDVKITADSQAWLAIIAGDANILAAIVLRKVRVKGDMRLFRAFGRCFA
ncbi:SCP2 sterol-binding domain-containing protein [Bradyrhizobium sp. WD16]|uniref:SCP2 sterol-binding domain-containing protein n=1 Tax=Bradyrhizobium sp. WD16 TaxID=1521768 RepID=UPI0020A6047B|nr:SCP2 sterol-binding domain-containing protein [Bradyrhizobium sp. WD16]UTD27638.1 4Fe-4S ferredoxin [Bradyrhizobium sp. WD16]